MQGRDVCAAVVGQDGLDGDPVSGVEGDRATQETDRGGAGLVGEDLGIGQACGVIDRDVRVSELLCVRPEPVG